MEKVLSKVIEESDSGRRETSAEMVSIVTPALGDSIHRCLRNTCNAPDFLIVF